MKVKVTYKCPIGPVESDPTEFEVKKILQLKSMSEN